MRAGAGGVDGLRPTKDKRRVRLLPGVDEQRQAPSDEVQCMLDLPLEVADQLEVVGQTSATRGFEPGLQAIEEDRSECIVAAAGVAAGQNHDRGERHFRRFQSLRFAGRVGVALRRCSGQAQPDTSASGCWVTLCGLTVMTFQAPPIMKVMTVSLSLNPSPASGEGSFVSR